MNNGAITVSKETLTQKIYDDLLQKFLNNELVPGTVIDRKELAAEYQVSIAPIRDALARLAQEGFIEIRSRSVTIVKAIQKEDIFGTLTMREALESQVARMICGSVVSEHYEELEAQAKLVDQTEDIMSYWHEDVAFHRQLVELSGCRLLTNTYNQIMNVGNFYQINSFFMNNDPLKRVRHTELLHSLLTDDPDVAERSIREHLKAGKTNLNI